jgi:hypothetical protein
MPAASWFLILVAAEQVYQPGGYRNGLNNLREQKGF